MAGSAMFVNDEKKAIIRNWHLKFLQKISVPHEDATVDTTFGKTHALIAGPPDAPPLVLLHGALASSAHVLPEVAPLLATRRVYAIDGIGQSAMSQDRRIELKDDSYGRWLVEATAALGLEEYDLYGVSWGGFVALRSTIAAPQRVKHLVLLVPAGWVGNSFWAGMRDGGWPLLKYKVLPSPKHFEQVLKSQFTTLDAGWSAYFNDALQSYRLDMRVPPIVKEEEVSVVKCPTLVFAAEKDASFPGKALLARVKKLLPHAEVELLEGARHCPQLTPEFRTYMAQRIEKFLTVN